MNLYVNISLSAWMKQKLHFLNKKASKTKAFSNNEMKINLEHRMRTVLFNNTCTVLFIKWTQKSVLRVT